MLFALIAGAGTALTPCVLPLLPALLASSASGGRRRPIGIVVGLTLTYTLAIVGLASLVDGVGVAGGLARDVAIVVLLGAGLALLWPPLGSRVEALASRLVARFAPRGAGAGRGGDGFLSGLLIGGALGFLWAPCAGPILAAVISVGATEGASLELVLVALSFGIGSAAVLLLVALGGRRVLDRVRRAGRGPVLQRALGGVMALTAVAMAAELDLRFQEALADDAPSFLVNPTRALEVSSAVEDRLADLRGKPRFEAIASPHASGASAAAPADLDVLGIAPDFQGDGPWLNSRPLSLAGLRGRVVLVDFWTYTCINCIRTLPYLKAWDERYRSRGLTIVGVHTPEFTFERETANVERAIGRQELRYPVLQDNEYATWNAWGNQYWPAKYMIDARGRVRYVHFGEGDYEETEDAIRALLAEGGREPPPERVRARADSPSAGVATPETYLGFDRAEGFVRPPRPGTHTYRTPTGELAESRFALSGTWRVDGESATAIRDAGLQASFTAAKVFLVLGSRGGTPRKVRVAVDGGRERAVTVRDQTLYELVSLPRAGTHLLGLRFDPGVTGFAFTFG